MADGYSAIAPRSKHVSLAELDRHPVDVCCSRNGIRAWIARELRPSTEPDQRS
jgi:hypothetical protein